MKTTFSKDVAERLIVAADFTPVENESIDSYTETVLDFAKKIKGIGVVIKVNSILRAAGYDLIHRLHDLGLQTFADLKLIDISNTLERDGAFLHEAQPRIVTCMANASVNAMSKLKWYLHQNTELLGVTVLTSLDEEECQAVFGCSTKAGVLRFARLAKAAGIDGLILSPNENKIITDRADEFSGLNLVNPGIRPEWSLVEGDDQKRVMTPLEAIRNGARRIVLGRPILRAQDPQKAIFQTLEEIEKGLDELVSGTTYS